MPRKYDTRPYFTQEEYQRLADLIDVLEDKTLIVVGIECGCRVSEVTRGFPAEMVDFGAATAQIYDEKKNVWRVITIPEPARSLLRMYLNEQKRTKGPVFPFSYKTANRRLKHWCARAGIKKYRDGREVAVSWHAVRHTFVRLSKVSGRDPMAVAQQLGNTFETVMKTYGTWEPVAMARHFDSKALLAPQPRN